MPLLLDAPNGSAISYRLGGWVGLGCLGGVGLGIAVGVGGLGVDVRTMLECAAYVTNGSTLPNGRKQMA